MAQLADMHVHLGFMSNRREVAQDCGSRGIALLAASVSPADYERCRADLASLGSPQPLVVCALGSHPWWIADGRVAEDDLTLFEQLAPETSAFGEVGLDFSDKHTPPESHKRQMAAFRRICAVAARVSRAAGRRLPMTIHSVRAASVCLDILEETGALEACAPIFHWFSGSGPEMARAVKAGCWFSCNEHGLKTGKGREYAKLIPANRLLLETDLPPSEGQPFSVEAIQASLERAAALLASARHEEVSQVYAQTTENARLLLNTSSFL